MSSANAFQARAVPAKEIPLSDICKSEPEKTQRKLPYEVELYTLAHLTERNPTIIREEADEAGILRRWPVKQIKGNRYGHVYLVRTQEEEIKLGINGHSPQQLKIEECIDHHVGEKTPIIFPEKGEYPYHVRMDMLAGRMTYTLPDGVVVKLDELRKRAKKLGLSYNGVCDFESREQEMMLLYCEPEKVMLTKSEMEMFPLFPDLPKRNFSKKKMQEFGPFLNEARPKTRAECDYERGNCPWVGCKYHLGAYVDKKTKELQLENAEIGLFEREETCALDVAELGGLSLEDVGEVMGKLTRERIRQIEARAIGKLMNNPEARELLEMIHHHYNTHDDSLKKVPLYRPSIRVV
ncbi:hypothetical protein KY339_03580 [Candidatus Woesearchaeota archaeon]|nr:hypothetical protein [Candidatus Woesearchaeota archaeon]